MPLTEISSDPEALTLTVVADYPVPVQRLWQAWADPRLLERFWGPPTWPASFSRHDLRVGGASAYRMTGPLGEEVCGAWEVLAVEGERRLLVRDAFCHPDGTVNQDLPQTQLEVTFSSTDAGSRFVAVSTFPSLAAMEQLAAMGMVEGLSQALGQLDALLAELRSLAAGPATQLELLDDVRVRVTREVQGGIWLVWRAYHEAALVRRWMLGPDGWTMPVCVVTTQVGGSFRYEWEDAAGEQRFGFEGELLTFEPPRRAVTTERMIGMDGEGTRNELVLSPRPGGRTRIELVITYPSRELRDYVLGTGMVDGMEASYARLEGLLSEA